MASLCYAVVSHSHIIVISFWIVDFDLFSFSPVDLRCVAPRWAVSRQMDLTVTSHRHNVWRTSEWSSSFTRDTTPVSDRHSPGPHLYRQYKLSCYGATTALHKKLWQRYIKTKMLCIVSLQVLGLDEARYNDEIVQVSSCICATESCFHKPVWLQPAKINADISWTAPIKWYWIQTWWKVEFNENKKSYSTIRRFITILA